MKRKPMRPIDVVNHLVHREASKGGVPECFMRTTVAGTPFVKAPAVKRLAKAERRARN